MMQLHEEDSCLSCVTVIWSPLPSPSGRSVLARVVNNVAPEFGRCSLQFCLIIVGKLKKARLVSGLLDKHTLQSTEHQASANSVAHIRQREENQL